MSVSNLTVCYRADGTASADVPCDPSANVSACCGAGSVCVQNLYCRTQWGANVPGTCTDALWGSGTTPNPNCPCRPRYRSNDDPLNYLDNVTFCSDGSYCCGVANSDCCNAGKGDQIIVFGNTATVPEGTALLPSYYSSVKVTTLPVTHTTFTSVVQANTTTATATTTLTAAPTTSTAHNTSGGLSKNGKIGVGVGVSLTGLLLAVALGFLFVYWRKYRNGETQDSQYTGSMTQVYRRK